MPELFTLMLIGGALLAATVVLWPYICDLIQRRILPAVCKNFGEELEGLLKEVVVFIDKKATPARALLTRAWRAFKQTVLGMKTTYKKTGANQATATTESYLQNEGRIIKVVEEQELGWDDLPPEIREQMLKHQTSAGTLDQLKVVESAMKERATEEQMVEVLAA